MTNLLRNTTIAAIITMIIAPLVAFFAGFEGAVVVMVMIAVVAFFTVVFVMIIGSGEGHYPTQAAESASVTAWTARIDAKEKQIAAVQAVQEPVTVEKVAEKEAEGAVGSLSDAEREAKKQAALERRRKRAEMKAKQAESEE